MSRRSCARRALAVAIGALSLLAAWPASAHPFGQKPVALIQRVGTAIEISWVIAPDDVRVLAQHLGLAFVRPEALPQQVALRRYFGRRLRVEAAEECEGSVLSVAPVSTGYAFRTRFECGTEVARARVRLTLLQDIDRNYITLFEAATAGIRRRGAFTTASPTAMLDFATGATIAPSPVPTPSGGEGRTARILAMLQGQSGSTSVVFALVLAFVLGALHGVTPGHGKTITAAYLVGAGGTVRQALALGGVVSATHALSVGLLGGITVALGAQQPGARVGAALEVAAGALILGLGATMLRRRARAHDHDHPDAAAPTLRRLGAIGFVGGLVPGPEALAIALVAFSVGRWTLGAALIVAFSLGLAAVVLGIAVAAVRGAGVVRRLAGGRLAVAAPRVAAAIFLAMGIAVTVNGARRF